MPFAGRSLNADLGSYIAKFRFFAQFLLCQSTAVLVTSQDHEMNADKIYESVLDRYTAAARGADPSYSHSVAKSFGYTEEELASVPQDANLGLSCGNPTAIASLREVQDRFHPQRASAWY